jgi:hypothetical protein
MGGPVFAHNEKITEVGILEPGSYQSYMGKLISLEYEYRKELLSNPMQTHIRKKQIKSL